MQFFLLRFERTSTSGRGLYCIAIELLLLIKVSINLFVDLVLCGSQIFCLFK